MANPPGAPCCKSLTISHLEDKIGFVRDVIYALEILIEKRRAVAYFVVI
jgi:hypothetical protein